MKLYRFLMMSCLAFAGVAQAEIYKQVDSKGNVTYSNQPIKGGKKLNLEPLPTMEPFKNNFPSVNSDTQRKRDRARRQILEDELSSEQDALDKARQDLQTAQDNPEVKRGPVGNVMVDTEKQDEKTKGLQNQISSHQRNIDAIQNELSRLK